MPYGERWRVHRRVYMQLLNAQAAGMYRRVQDMRSRQLVVEMLSTDDFSASVYRYTSDVMAELVYGQRENNKIQSQLDQINERAMFILKNAAFHTTILDLFPALDYLPAKRFMLWRTQAAHLHEQTKEVYVECAATALESPVWNWTKEVRHDHHARFELEKISWEEVCYSIGELYVAGIHTTKMVLENFITACVAYPQTADKAQKELDSVVGSSRLPRFEDRERLPYLNAFLMELMRWKPISPIGVPHALVHDDEYMGFNLPRNATVIANQWGFNMDQEVFVSPEEFNPERYAEHGSDTGERLPGFGFGRRACPGYHLASQSLFIVIARMLWAFSIDSFTPRISNIEVLIRQPALQK
ncbi:hypothetical protein ASPZODRAFT_134551 [Penicilliopsis zonata CBS 506.65]|uniref:Cytochrome P450 n=1 Tax=Penicilliopsis zonata CBS 506.65 TaxID=1073090 RepID=A0A1L9SD49_9EURO|nr:hypothetical protein ASPZODRAFT_134551 [Penicilliopsis zonata CBS 506.65]OJJ45126.1 hypothetical protein ASPZODRAFT_134551 [Penicilliopsis zonata CBS 506.65]